MTEPSSTGRLWAAVDQITNPTRHKLVRDDGTVDHHDVDSLWTQLEDALGNSTETGTGKSSPTSRPPLAIDAAALHMLIEWEVGKRSAKLGVPFDHRTHGWLPPALRALASATVTAQQDTDQLAADVTSWCGQIRAIIGDTAPARRLRAHACIECGSTGVRRTNSEGDSTIVWPIILRPEPDGLTRGECEACGHRYVGDDLHRLAEQDTPEAKLTA